MRKAASDTPAFRSNDAQRPPPVIDVRQTSTTFVVRRRNVGSIRGRLYFINKYALLVQCQTKLDAMRITNQRTFSTNINRTGQAMNNTNPPIDAEAASDRPGRPSGHHGVRGGGQDRRCGGPPTWAEIMPHIGPFGPPLMYGSSEFLPPFMHRPMHSPWDRQLPPMNGPSQFGSFNSSWRGGLRTIPGPSTFGPTAWPWCTRPRGAEDATDTESDDQHAGKDSAEDVGKEAHEKQDGASDENADQHGDRLRHHGMRGSQRHGHGRRRNPYGMHRRCHRWFGAHSHGPPWSTGPGECHQPGYPTGWGEFPLPPPFFDPSPWDCTGGANDDPENDTQKQDVGAQTRKVPGRLSSFVSRQRRMNRPCVRLGQKHCDTRDKLLSMLSWKRAHSSINYSELSRSSNVCTRATMKRKKRRR